jgi:hypothetical protein
MEEGLQKALIRKRLVRIEIKIAQFRFTLIFWTYRVIVLLYLCIDITKYE